MYVLVSIQYPKYSSQAFPSVRKRRSIEAMLPYRIVCDDTKGHITALLQLKAVKSGTVAVSGSAQITKNGVGTGQSTSFIIGDELVIFIDHYANTVGKEGTITWAID